MPNSAEVIDGMERMLTQLRAAQGSPAWRATVLESSVLFSRGVAALLESLQTPAAPDELLLKAQKYARVKVAQIQLYAAAEVTAGRAAHNLYAALRAPIDEARAGFTQEFLTAAREIPDYLHAEIVRVLAHNDEALLGEGYPGPLL